MSLKYTCPGCGTPLGYDGLCWKCKCEQERKTAFVGLSMMCYRLREANKTCLGERQERGRMGKLL